MRLDPGEAEYPRLYGEWVSESPSAANAAVALPDRVTVLSARLALADAARNAGLEF